MTGSQKGVAELRRYVGAGFAIQLLAIGLVMAHQGGYFTGTAHTLATGIIIAVAFTKMCIVTVQNLINPDPDSE